MNVAEQAQGCCISYRVPHRQRLLVKEWGGGGVKGEGGEGGEAQHKR
jgi:hypothetical protein